MQEHFYHVLECSKATLNSKDEHPVLLPDPDAPELPPPFKPDTPPPVYQEITQLSSSRPAAKENEYIYNEIVSPGQ